VSYKGVLTILWDLAEAKLISAIERFPEAFPAQARP